MMATMAFAQFDTPEVMLNASTRNAPIYEYREYQPPARADVSSTEARRLIEGRQPSTVATPLPIQHQIASQLDRTIATLNQYANSPAGGNSSPARQALVFLCSLPSYLPAPKAAESDSGMVTLFWDTDQFYADVEFRGDERLSLFSRSRVDGANQDEALDDYPIGDAVGEWLNTHLGPLFPRLHSKAA